MILLNVTSVQAQKKPLPLLPMTPYVGLEQSEDSKLVLGLSRTVLAGKVNQLHESRVKERGLAVALLLPLDYEAIGGEITYWTRSAEMNSGGSSSMGLLNGRLLVGIGAGVMADTSEFSWHLKPQFGLGFPAASTDKLDKRFRYGVQIMAGYKLTDKIRDPELTNSAPWFVRLIIYKVVNRSRIGVVN